MDRPKEVDVEVSNTEPVEEQIKPLVIKRNIFYMDPIVENGSEYQNYLIRNKYCRELIIPYEDTQYESFILEYLTIDDVKFVRICYKQHSIEKFIQNKKSPPYVLYYSITNEDKTLPKPTYSIFSGPPPRPILPLPTLYSLVNLKYYNIDTREEIWKLKSLPQRIPQSTTPQYYPLISDNELQETTATPDQVQQSCIQHTIDMLTNNPPKIYTQYSTPTDVFWSAYNNNKPNGTYGRRGQGSALTNGVGTFGPLMVMGGKSKKRKRKKRKTKKSRKY